MQVKPSRGKENGMSDQKNLDLAHILNAIERQKINIRREEGLLVKLNDLLVEKFCPVQVGATYKSEERTILVKKIAWHYAEAGIYWVLSGIVLKDNGQRDGRYSGLHSVQVTSAANATRDDSPASDDARCGNSTD
jgi:hypothetical protein